jgi:hypothetical protein
MLTEVGCSVGTWGGGTPVPAPVISEERDRTLQFTLPAQPMPAIPGNMGRPPMSRIPGLVAACCFAFMDGVPAPKHIARYSRAINGRCRSRHNKPTKTGGEHNTRAQRIARTTDARPRSCSGRLRSRRCRLRRRRGLRRPRSSRLSGDYALRPRRRRRCGHCRCRLDASHRASGRRASARLGALGDVPVGHIRVELPLAVRALRAVVNDLHGRLGCAAFVAATCSTQRCS